MILHQRRKKMFICVYPSGLDDPGLPADLESKSPHHVIYKERCARAPVLFTNVAM